MNVNGYETMTTFWQDFTIADKFGVAAIKDTFNRAFNEWKNNYQYLTELVMVLNWKIWEYYEKNREFAEVYNKLWEKQMLMLVKIFTEKKLNTSTELRIDWRCYLCS